MSIAGSTSDGSIAEGPTSESMAEGVNDTLLPSLVLLRVVALDNVVVGGVGGVAAGAVKTGPRFRFKFSCRAEFACVGVGTATGWTGWTGWTENTLFC